MYYEKVKPTIAIGKQTKKGTNLKVTGTNTTENKTQHRRHKAGKEVNHAF